MSAQANYYKIGLFVVIATMLAIAFVIVLGAGSLFKKTIIVETYIDGSVQGLTVGSPVKFRGVPIGKVNEIDVVSWEYPTKYQYILVRATLPSHGIWFQSEKNARSMFLTETVKGLRARLASQGLTGASFLEIDYLDPKANPILPIDWDPAHPYLPSAPSTITRLSDSMTSIMNSLQEINLQGIMARLETTLDTLIKTLNAANISGISQEAHSLLAELRTSNQHLDEVLSGPKTQNMLNNADATLSGAKRIVESSEKPLSEFLITVDSATKSLDSLAKGLDTSSKDLPEILTQIKATLQRLDNLLALPQQDLEETIQNLRAVSQNLKELTEETKKFPAYTFFGEPPTRLKPGEQP
jgi:phospholipid/cholesterol/gamma-HCH transport system substrate-binding protein/paraquat-inducible protein B